MKMENSALMGMFLGFLIVVTHDDIRIEGEILSQSIKRPL
jgi:hypothetical protein